MDCDLTRALIQAASAGGGLGYDTGGGNEVLATWPPDAAADTGPRTT